MKSSFFEFEQSEQPISEIWDDPETIFVFDINIYLNLYVFHERSRQIIYKALDKIKTHLWSPHHVMLELHKNRESHIHKNEKYFDTADKFLTEFLEQFKTPYIK